MTLRWFIRRMGLMLVVLFFAVCVNFALPRLMPGGVMETYLQEGVMTPEMQEAILRKFGLDKPVMTQFWIYLKNTFTGEYGISFFYYPRSVGSLIWAYLPYSMALLWISMILRQPIAIMLGIIAGWRPGSKVDSFIQGSSLALMAMPTFWIGMCFLYIFAYILGWFPLGGALTAAYDHPNALSFVGDWIKHAFLPILTMSHMFGAGQLIMRNTMITTLREQYIVTAEAKGISENRVKYRHAARNALLPVITGMIIRFSMTLAGSVYIETVFSYPGIGRLMFSAVQNGDYPVIQACFFFYALITLASIIIIDVVYTRLDPRIRF
jgi:peptide/nickel transport system permease protein